MILRLALTCSMLAGAALSQSAAEQLQKGIYAQDSAGDLDRAIAVYREIVRSNPSQRAVAATAQMRLAQALLQKGDLAAAAREFDTLSRDYAEFSDLIASMAARMGSGTRQSNFTLGTVNGNHYRHKVTGIEVTLPREWSFTSDWSIFDGEMLGFRDVHSIVSAFVFMSPLVGTSTTKSATFSWDERTNDVRAALETDLKLKPAQRRDFTGWMVRPGTIQHRTIAGAPALTAVADYKEGGRDMVEYMTWIRSTANRAFFSARMSASELQVLQPVFDRIMMSSRIP